MNCIVTIVETHGHSEYLDIFERYTKNRMISYAKRIGARLKVWTQNNGHTHIFYQKREIAKLLEEYDRVLYVDADVFIKKSALNIFHFVPNDRLGMCNEYRDDCRQYVDDCCGRYNPYASKAGEKQLTFQDFNVCYYNAGVILANQGDRVFFANSILPEKLNGWMDQDWFNYRIVYNNYPMFNFGYEFNAMMHIPNILERLNEYHFIHANRYYSDLPRKMEWINKVDKALQSIGE